MKNYRAGSTTGRPTGQDDWRTPPELFARLDEEFHFRMDAACSSGNALTARHLSVDDGRDGLLEPWAKTAADGAAWCNPPYSRVEPWLMRGKLYGRLVPVVMLVPADTSTQWWLRQVAHDASEVRFLIGRPKFLRPDGTRHDTKCGGGGSTTAIAVVVYRPGGGPPSYSYMPARPKTAA